MTRITVAPASLADSAEAARLLHAMERHYEGASAASEAQAMEAIEGMLLPSGAGVGMLLARAEATAVGLATFSVLFPTDGFRPGLFVKDAFVCESWRRAGVGMALFGALAREALRRGCVRIDWAAARDNIAAGRLYEKAGAMRLDEAILFRLDAERIARLAAGGLPT